jgi:hypothetical protein
VRCSTACMPTALLEQHVLSSELQNERDRAAVDRFLVEAYDRAWSGELDHAP